MIARLDAIAETGLSWITFAPAWPTLRTHLLLLNATGVDPLLALNEALAQGSLKDAHDAAAVLDWRLDATRGAPAGPLPWLPGIPERLTADPKWGVYLTERASLVTTSRRRGPSAGCRGDPGPPPGSVRRAAPTGVAAR